MAASSIATQSQSQKFNLIRRNSSNSNAYHTNIYNNNTNTNSSSLQLASNYSSANMVEYSLADVYDDAAIIGSELEKIISNYGSDVLKDLMPKVINVLELLEGLTIKKEKENDEINELKMRINSLEIEKTTRLNEREKFEKELEEIEEKWKLETMKLIGMVNKLKEENKRLNESLDQNQNLNSKQNDHFVIKQEELDYIKQIKEENIKLKELIRFKDREIEQKNTENEGLLSQVDRLSSTMLNLRRKQILAQNQIEKMVKSKAEIECSLTEKEHQINLIKEKLRIKNLSDLDSIIEPKANNTDNSASSSKPSTITTTVPAAVQHPSTVTTIQADRLSTDLTDLLIYDAKDPNRPRFTLKELQKVLMEKNELTIKLDQTQDELEQLRKQETINYGEVQGPINKEPEEKLDPSNKQNQTTTSGIRRFFSFFFSSINNTIQANEESSLSLSSSSTQSNTDNQTSNSCSGNNGTVFVA